VIDGAALAGLRVVGLQEDEARFAKQQTILRLIGRAGLPAHIFGVPLDSLRRIGNSEMHVVIGEVLGREGRFGWRARRNSLSYQQEHSKEQEHR
jgi:hypothetical protein